MKKFSRVMMIAGLLVIGVGVLSGCDSEDSDSDIKTDTVAQIGKNSKDTKLVEPKVTTSDIPHSLQFGDKTINLTATYGIEQKRLNNWVFTTSSTVHLGLKAVDVPENVEVMVNNVYSEVSIISTKAYKNGIRQDSINQSYNNVGAGGMSIDPLNDFTLPFQVEGINQNQTSFYVINGYGSTSTDRLTESEVRKNAQGGLLNTVWTVTIKDKESEQVFSKTINDKIGLPCDKSDD